MSTRPALVVTLACAAVACGDGTASEPASDAGTEATAPSDAGVDAPAEAGGPLLPPGVNALLLPNAGPNDAPIALYQIGTSRRGIAFTYDGTVLTALDEGGAPRWQKTVGAGTLFGGFDADGDGRVDLALVRAKELATQCYGKPLHERRIDVILAEAGALHPDVVPPLSDVCWNFGYATEQWSVLAALFGGPTRDLVFVPQYTSTNANALTPYQGGKAWVVGFDGKGFVDRGTITMPTTPAYDAFAAALPEAHGSGTKYYAASHVPNGLVDGDLVFFTSGRVVRYAMTAPYALAADRPFLTAGRTDLVGRCYGLVMPDPLAPSRVALISGTTSQSLFADMVAGKMVSDPYGGIERHVTVHDRAANTVDDRFFSYAHDGGDAFLYEGRVAFADAAWIAAPGATASRLIFDVYVGGRWHAIVTTTGGTTTALDVRDLYVWDVRDLDGDGVLDVVASPSHDPADPDVPGWYFTKWRTLVMHWDEATKQLVTVRTIPDAIPWLIPAFRDATRSTSGGFRYPVPTVAVGGKAALVLRRADGSRALAPL